MNPVHARLQLVYVIIKCSESLVDQLSENDKLQFKCYIYIIFFRNIFDLVRTRDPHRLAVWGQSKT